MADEMINNFKSPNTHVKNCVIITKTKRIYLLVHCFAFSMYWDYAMNVNLEEVVYVHCHQKSK